MKQVLVHTIPYTPKLPVTTTSNELLPVHLYNLRRVSPHPNLQNLVSNSYSARNKTWYLMLEWDDTEWEPLSNLTTAATSVLDEDDVRDVTVQLLDVVEHCLRRGVEHRDISVENILINRDTNQIKLANFQHSTVLSVVPHTLHTAHSTSSSTPPELYTQGWYTPHQGAVWSVGCIIFEMITRAKPVLSAADTAANNVRWERLRPHSMTSELYDLVLTCLNPVPQRRLTWEKLIKHPWLVNETLV